MGKLIAAFNMTLDGYCDHTAINPDQEIHQHYADLLRSAGTLLYGRTTYHLMEYWREVVDNPTGDTSTDDFAAVMDKTPKVVFSHTLKDITWASARLATRPLAEEATALRLQAEQDILVGSRSLIIQLMNLNLLDEFQLCVHPVIAAGGLPLFEHINDRITLQLSRTKTFGSGAVIFYYALKAG